MDNSVRIGGLNNYLDVVTRLGGNPEDLLDRCDIPFEAFEDEDNIIKYSQLAELLEITSQELKKPDFGLYLGTRQKVNILGPVSIAIQTASTVGEAMQCAARFLHIQSSALNYHMDEQHPDYVRTIVDINIPELSHRQMPQNIDRCVAVGQEIWKQLSGDKFNIPKIEIPRELSFPKPMYESYFDSDIEFNSESIVWYISRDTYEAPLPLSCKRLHEFASHYLEEQFPGKNERLAVLVERELRKNLEVADCTREWMANFLELHPRTLQRLLTKEHSSFEEIRNKVRKERVIYYLCNTKLPFSQIANLVGYSGQAALSRSCQRWFSKSPRQIRGNSRSYMQSQNNQ
ncbi:AraC family transcriptional regulator [Pseudoteredinibacter isoporae]|uniref:AraC-like DNA-binding protein n=1 Tax=Pseudoteredinibacter isoporae TaxID=570281 RepID=A0A7X0JX43_9GAMM|nr:AraC family transcriptional regulator [Pseudoteredinibacter isoporae]MBB6523016.1 AraC-like DNA-binding protein [Pseudoteredinibacter isoporae]NHO88538.1 AraC family transcriptional regulator [Pseudoteredinibacter isoporae]NIB22771.1 AraC family transcriptional regulator [Pseudoteredinibacter isoporae]